MTKVIQLVNPNILQFYKNIEPNLVTVFFKKDFLKHYLPQHNGFRLFLTLNPRVKGILNLISQIRSNFRSVLNTSSSLNHALTH